MHNSFREFNSAQKHSSESCKRRFTNLRKLNSLLSTHWNLSLRFCNIPYFGTKWLNSIRCCLHMKDGMFQSTSKALDCRKHKKKRKTVREERISSENSPYENLIYCNYFWTILEINCKLRFDESEKRKESTAVQFCETKVFQLEFLHSCRALYQLSIIPVLPQCQMESNTFARKIGSSLLFFSFLLCFCYSAQLFLPNTKFALRSDRIKLKLFLRSFFAFMNR